MGNIINKKQLNSECPICFEKKKDMVLLNCGHNFDRYCIQKSIFHNILDNVAILCPLCRDNIKESKIKKIFTPCILYNIRPSEWINFNTIILNKTIRIFKFNYILVDDIIYFIPVYSDSKGNSIIKHNIPAFLLLENVMLDTENIENDMTEYFNKKLTFKIDKNNINEWFIFIYNNYLHDIMFISKNKINAPNNYIDLYIRNTNDMIIYDTYNGEYYNKLDLCYNRNATILFSLYGMKNNLTGDVYFVNELHGILYN